MQGLAAAQSPLRGKWMALFVLLLCQVGAMAVWFSSTAVTARIQATLPLNSGEVSWLTSSVQLGFVLGTLLSAALSLADRWEPRRLFALSALIAAGATMALAFLEPVSWIVYGLRFITGMCMAGVYPVGMRLAATWARGDLGLLVGLLVGALALGSASPHVVAGLIDIEWRSIYVIASVGALLAAVGIRGFQVGPGLQRATAIDVRRMLQAFSNPAIRLANLGYLGHMWELYAMWAWLGTFLAASFSAAGHAEPVQSAALLTFVAIASGAPGAWLGGWIADRIGRTALTSAAMLVSGSCALAMGWLGAAPFWLIALVAILWGASAIADSAQFSATVTELSSPESVGTLLTIQTCAGFSLTLVSIHLVPWVVDLAGWGIAFGVLSIGPFLGCLAMLRLRGRPEALQIAHGKR